jgi:hypothetical protein
MARYDRSYGPGFRGQGGGSYRGTGYDRGMIHWGGRTLRGYDAGYQFGGRMGRGRYAGERMDRPETYHQGWRVDEGGYGGAARGYDRGFGRPQGGPGMEMRGYDAGFAREPFMPESAYLRHPEYDRPPTYHQNRWERPGEYLVHDEPLGDEEIRQEVRARLYHDSWLDADSIEVEVEDGVVTLRGEVGDFLEARYAWDDAWETGGVRGVVNHLRVRTDRANDAPHGDVLPQDVG